MPDWIKIRVKTEPAKMKYTKGRIQGFASEAMGKYFFQQLQGMTASGADVMRNFISSHPSVRTRTGAERKARGGNGPGRVDTGLMKDSIKWRYVGKGANGNYRFEFGWINGTPGYAIFQEQGTKNGVRAMNSIAYATAFMRNELQLLGQSRRATRLTRNAQWRHDA